MTNLYKDFFKITNYLETDNLDFTYKTVVITEGNLHQGCEDTIASFEKFNVAKTLAIFNFLKYKLHSEQDPQQREWLEKNINFFTNALSNIKNDKTFITPEHIFINQKYEKVFYDNDKKIGRLYNHNSMQTLPRELRYYMFKDDYIDFDIENAHPTILYLYSKKHKIKLNGALREYVRNKTSVMFVIQLEINLAQPRTMCDLPISHVKEKVLTLLNKTWDGSTNGTKEKSTTLSRLDDDFMAIRNHLWDSFCEGKLPGYSDAIHKSITKKQEKYTSSGVVDTKKLNLLEKVVLQSFYCQTQETEHLMKLIGFLREKYSVFILKVGKPNFSDFHPHIDKKVALGARHTLSVVPFFDGVYISSPCNEFMTSLTGLVDEYNSKEIGVTFVKKNIEEHRSRIPDTDELRKFIIINSWLSNSTSEFYLDQLLSKTEIYEKAVELLQDKTKFENEKKWENNYGQKLESLKSLIFKQLLEHPIENQSDINEIIKKL